MQDINIKSYNKTLKVNEQGDTIVLDFDNGTFENEFYVMMEKLETKLEEFKEEVKKIEDEKDELKIAKITRTKMNELNEYLAEMIESIFGEGTCKKVFGTQTPSYIVVGDFIQQLAPFMKQHRKEMNKKFNKYSPERSGNA